MKKLYGVVDCGRVTAYAGYDVDAKELIIKDEHGKKIAHIQNVAGIKNTIKRAYLGRGVSAFDMQLVKVELLYTEN